MELSHRWRSSPKSPIADNRRWIGEIISDCSLSAFLLIRLLRETRDIAFKPALIVQKPISLVPEKIRRRKLEIEKKDIFCC
ncbi:hypothetical protein V6N13_129854 [Hibiscus sabdariffa]